MEYLNRFKSTVHSVAAQVTQALPGNPIFREYECHDQIATAGPGHAWKIYSGTKHSTKQNVSIWLFDKKYCDKWSKQDKDAFPELLKRGISQLTRLRHPRLLIVEHALEESRDTLAFCTEPVFASLANIFGEDDHGQGIDSKFAEFKLEDIEIRHGLFQLGEALAFLHNDAKLLHGNICPSSVIINEKGAWKLSGFDFCVLGTPNSNAKITFTIPSRDRRSLSVLHPVLDYSAPEFVDATKCDHFADIFSLGVLSFAIFNANRPIYSSNNVYDAYEKNCEKLRKLTINEFTRISADFRDDVKACLNFTPELRPDAIQFTKIAYFDDTLVKTLNYLDSLMQMDNTQKMQFFKGLPQVLAKFPQRALVQKVFPYLVAEFNTPQLIPFILPSIFIIAEQAKDDEFSKIIFPQMIPIFSMTNPYQIVLLLLQKMTLFLQKTPEGDIKRYVLPLIYGAIMNENTKIQELCLNIIPNVGKLVERDQMKTQLLPKLIKLSLEGPVLAIRIQTLVCIGKLMPTLEPWMVSDQILPALPKINSKEPGILMAVLGIYKLANENERFGIGREQCAKSVLPFLISMTVENTLNLPQFEQYMTMTRVLLEKVEREQRTRLQQLSAGQEEQRNFQDFNELIKADATKVNEGPDLDALSALFGGSGGGNGARSGNNSGATTGNTALTLEEKKRLAAEQENSLRSKTTPMIGLSGSASTQGKSMNSLMMSSTNNLFDAAPKRVESNSYSTGAPQMATNNDFMFNDFVSNSATSSSKPMTSSSGFGGFALPPPPAASNPVHKAGMNSNFGGFSLPPPPGGSTSGFGALNSSSTNDDILDLFKSAPASSTQKSANIDELLALANSIPSPPKGPQSNGQRYSKDPFADILK